MNATLGCGTPKTAFAAGPIAPPERLPVLDILRGVAILGMFIVILSGAEGSDPGGGAIGATIQRAILWFGANKFATMFQILIGVGFAIQLRRADTRGEDIRWAFLRRLLGVAGFGVLIGALIGAVELIGYAYSGVWLLLVRRWSTRALLIALLVSMILAGVWNVAVGSYQWATMGAERANAVYRSRRPVSPARQAALTARV